MDEIKKTKGKQIKEPNRGKSPSPPPSKVVARGGAKNSFPIKLYPFALIYWFHALSPLLTAAA